MFYVTLFFLALYFKIARVHKKEEKSSSVVLIQHILVGISVASTLIYGFRFENSIVFLLLLLLFAVMASLMVTAIQLGIFVNGKPLFGLSRFYRYLPLMTSAIVLLNGFLWSMV